MALNKILLAVDNSEYSEKAAMLVLDLAQNASLDVIVMHVCDDVPMAVTDPEAIEQFEDELARDAMKVVVFYREILSRMGIRNSIRLTPGNVAEEITKCAEGEKCDLIVMGAKGHSALADLFMGSTSEKVLRHSSLPILLAR